MLELVCWGAECMGAECIDAVWACKSMVPRSLLYGHVSVSCVLCCWLLMPAGGVNCLHVL